MITRIIVGVDFSDTSKKALIAGKLWSEKLNAPLVAMHVVHMPVSIIGEGDPVGFYDTEWATSSEENAKKRLQEWTNGLSLASIEVVFGNPADELVGAADASTLLIVGHVGHSTIEHLLFGSTAERVVRHAPCDVLVVRHLSKQV